jgi:CheY-like chemotaxis protein
VEEQILVVDDEKNVLDGIERLLHGEFSISKAQDADQGLELIQQCGPLRNCDFRYANAGHERSPLSCACAQTCAGDRYDAADGIQRFRYGDRRCERGPYLPVLEETMQKRGSS